MVIIIIFIHCQVEKHKQSPVRQYIYIYTTNIITAHFSYCSFLSKRNSIKMH